MTPVSFAFAGWRKRPLRTVLSILSVMIAVGVLTVTVATTRKIREAVAGARSPKVIVGNLIEGRPLPLAYGEQIKQVPGVVDYSYTRNLVAEDRTKNKFHVGAVGERHPEVAVKTMWSAPADAVERWHADRTGIFVSEPTLEHFGWKVGDRVSVRTNVGELDANISGVVTGLGVAKLYMAFHYEYVDEKVKPEDKGKVGGFTVLLDDYDKLETVANTIDAKFANATDSTLTAPLDQFVAERLKKVSAIPELLIQIGILIVLVTTFITASTLGMSLLERRRELAVLRAIGYTRSKILRMVMLESVLLCALGGLFGSGLLWLLFHDEGLRMADVGVLSNMRIGPDGILLGLAMSAVLGIIVAIVPTLSTLRLDVAKVLSE